jgi:CRISPR/Cas system-associated protein endoribonuclease Cas2
MLYNEIIAVCSQIHTKHKYTVARTYRAVNTLRLGYKTSQLMLYSEIIAVCSQIHTKHKYTVARTYRAVNTHRLGYKNQSVNAVQ